MLRGLYTAYTGMEAQQEKMNIVSNNLANANTTGFKQDNVVFSSFKDVLAYKINDPDTKNTARIGSMSLGTKLDNTYTNFEQGGLTMTEGDFDIALEGQGMLVVGTPNADGDMVEHYTRDGSLTLNQNRELVTNDGEYVLGADGPIVIPDGNVSINQKGAIRVDNQTVDQLQLTAFEDMRTLRKIGDNLYTATDATQRTPYTGAVRQGYVESSNVNSVKEMIEMINVMRTYEANQKVLTTYDSTLENVVNNVGRV